MPDEPDRPTRKHVNAAERRALRSAEARSFMTRYGRRAQKGVEPNDRRYDREVEQRLKRLDPVEFDRLLREDED